MANEVRVPRAPACLMPGDGGRSGWTTRGSLNMVFTLEGFEGFKDVSTVHQKNEGKKKMRICDEVLTMGAKAIYSRGHASHTGSRF